MPLFVERFNSIKMGLIFGNACIKKVRRYDGQWRKHTKLRDYVVHKGKLGLKSDLSAAANAGFDATCSVILLALSPLRLDHEYSFVYMHIT